MGSIRITSVLVTILLSCVITVSCHGDIPEPSAQHQTNTITNNNNNKVSSHQDLKEIEKERKEEENKEETDKREAQGTKDDKVEETVDTSLHDNIHATRTLETTPTNESQEKEAESEEKEEEPVQSNNEQDSHPNNNDNQINTSRSDEDSHIKIENSTNDTVNDTTTDYTTLKKEDLTPGASEEELTHSDNNNTNGSNPSNEDSVPSNETDDDLVTFEEFKSRMTNQDTPTNNIISQDVPVTAHKGNNNNFASHECGAKVVDTNTETKNPWAILTDNKDQYMLNPCSAKIWFVIELCELVSVSRFEIGTFELFSSIPELFALYTSESFPTSNWEKVKEFPMSNERGLQIFNLTHLTPHRTVYAKYFKIVMLKHFGSEHYCPVSMVRVYGTTMIEEYEYSELKHSNNNNNNNDNNKLKEEDSSNDVTSDKGSDEGAADWEGNPLKAAKDAIFNVIGKAVNGLIGNEHKSTTDVESFSVKTEQSSSLIDSTLSLSSPLSSSQSSDEHNKEFTTISSFNEITTTSTTVLNTNQPQTVMATGIASLGPTTCTNMGTSPLPSPGSTDTTDTTPLTDTISLNTNDITSDILPTETITNLKEESQELEEEKGEEEKDKIHVNNSTNETTNNDSQKTTLNQSTVMNEQANSTPVSNSSFLTNNNNNQTDDGGTDHNRTAEDSSTTTSINEEGSTKVNQNSTTLTSSTTNEGIHIANSTTNGATHSTTNGVINGGTVNQSTAAGGNETANNNNNNNNNNGGGPRSEKSVFLRLSNRINNLELNMSLFGSYLDQISTSLKRSKNRTDDMQKSLERRMTFLNSTIQTQIQINKSLIKELTDSISQLSLMIRELHQDKSIVLELVLVLVLCLAGSQFIMLLCCIVLVLQNYKSTKILQKTLIGLRNDVTSMRRERDLLLTNTTNSCSDTSPLLNRNKRTINGDQYGLPTQGRGHHQCSTNGVTINNSNTNGMTISNSSTCTNGSTSTCTSCKGDTSLETLSNSCLSHHQYTEQWHKVTKRRKSLPSKKE